MEAGERGGPGRGKSEGEGESVGEEEGAFFGLEISHVVAGRKPRSSKGVLGALYCLLVLWSYC